ncbi:hypothetical protein ACJMK2_009827 [Sinanodonta woodiana]|uniref:Uncharacterized protein n=1 Tax=Sinanodonta woodiana TaxID=1069815 RepID=A0ABD3VFT4_SINWO
MTHDVLLFSSYNQNKCFKIMLVYQDRHGSYKDAIALILWISRKYLLGVGTQKSSVISVYDVGRRTMNCANRQSSGLLVFCLYLGIHGICPCDHKGEAPFPTLADGKKQIVEIELYRVIEP